MTLFHRYIFLIMLIGAPAHAYEYNFDTDCDRDAQGKLQVLKMEKVFDIAVFNHDGTDLRRKYQSAVRDALYYATEYTPVDFEVNSHLESLSGRDPSIASVRVYIWEGRHMPPDSQNAAGLAFWGTTTFDSSTCEISKVNIIINMDQTEWDSQGHAPQYSDSASEYAGDVAVHELGHVLGLEHSTRYLDTMGVPSHITEQNNCTASRRRMLFGERSTSALLDIYGQRSGYSWDDLKLTRYVPDPNEPDDDYADGQVGDFRDSRGLRVSKSIRAGHNAPRIKTGETYTVDFSALAMGASEGFSDEIEIGAYLSTNNCITTGSDRFLSKMTIPYMARGISPMKTSIQFTIPESYATGSYFIGIMVNPEGTIEEKTSYDNTIVIPVDITKVTNPSISCTTEDGNTIPHGGTATRTRYRDASVPQGGACVSETQFATCNNGTLTSFSGNYTYPSCIANAKPPSTSLKVNGKSKRKLILKKSTKRVKISWNSNFADTCTMNAQVKRKRIFTSSAKSGKKVLKLTDKTTNLTLKCKNSQGKSVKKIKIIRK